MLEEKCLDCQLEDSEGRTGLMVAAMEGRLGVVKLMLRYCHGCTCLLPFFDGFILLESFLIKVLLIVQVFKVIETNFLVRLRIAHTL